MSADTSSEAIPVEWPRCDPCKSPQTFDAYPLRLPNGKLHILDDSGTVLGIVVCRECRGELATGIPSSEIPASWRS